MGYLVNLAGGDLVACERLAGGRIEDGLAEAGEVAAAPGRNRNSRVQKLVHRTPAGGLEREEEEGPVAAIVEFGQKDWSADAAAGGVPNACGALQRKRIAGAEPGSGVVVEDVAVKLVGARLRDDGHLADGAELGRIVGHVDLDFLERLDVVGEGADLRVGDAVGEGDAVDRPVGLVGAAAGEADRARAPAGLQDVGREGEESPEAARVERQVAHDNGDFAVGEAGRFRFDEGRSGGDFDCGFNRAHFQGDVEAPQVARDEEDTLGDEFLESGRPCTDSVGALAQLREGVDSLFVRGDGALEIGLHMGGGDGGAGDDRAGGVRDRTR